MIITVNTLGASVPGFNRSDKSERKPDAGSSVVEVKSKENLQSTVALDGGQSLSDSRQVLRNNAIPSTTPIDVANNEVRHQSEVETASARGNEGGRRSDRDLNESHVSSNSAERIEENERDSQAFVRAQVQDRYLQEKVYNESVQTDIAKTSTAKSVEEQELAIKTERERLDVNEKTASEKEGEAAVSSAEYSSSIGSEHSAVPVETNSFGSLDESINDKEKESGNYNSQTSSSVDDLALSRPEKEGLRSFQQIAEVSAFEATGTTIDVSV